MDGGRRYTYFREALYLFLLALYLFSGGVILIISITGGVILIISIVAHIISITGGVILINRHTFERYTYLCISLYLFGFAGNILTTTPCTRPNGIC